MEGSTLVWIALLVALGATLCSTVGHAGASPCLAIMARFAVAPETMRPTALAPNLVVAGLGRWCYGQEGEINRGLSAAIVGGSGLVLVIAGTKLVVA
jgi:hypothetical protein